MRVALVIGTRPQIIKSAPIIKEAGRRGLELDVIHTGQHYDYAISLEFFNELELPDMLFLSMPTTNFILVLGSSE